MRDKLLSVLGIESGEESMISMLLTQSVFLGIFFGSFDISAHSLFLSIFDEKMMARGYVVSGIAGIILTALYTGLQTRMKFKNFASLNLVFVTSLSLLLWIALNLFSSKLIIFIVFVMLGPLNILAALGFWGTAGRLFTLRQGKRLFGLVDAGLVIGIIISCYTIPILLALKFESHNILLISALSVMIAAVIQIMIGSQFSFVTGKVETKPEKPEKKKSVITVFREDRYTRIMAIFVALSVVTAFFVQYSFMAVTRAQYPAEEDMARFLGIFTGSMMIFTLLVKLLVFSYLIRNYGLRTCLAISPLLVAVFTAIAIIVGMTMGYTPEATSGFLIFFLLLALSRLFSKSLKDSIESPSFKVIYQTIDEKIRYEIQSGMDGTVNEIAALSSGLILAGMGVLSFIKLIHFSWVLFIFIIIWVFIAMMLYNEYRKSIRKALESGNAEIVYNGRTDANFINNRFAAESTFRKDYFNLIAGDYSALESNMSLWYFRKIIDHSASANDTSLIPVLKKLNNVGGIDEENRRLSGELLKRLEEISSDGRSGSDKLMAARKVLIGSRLPQTTEILRLLRDNSIEAKRLGIFMIGKFKLTDLLTEVCNCLNISGLETDAFSVLNTFGNEAGSELERFYLASSGNINTSKTLLRLLGKISTRESRLFLFSRLWSNSRQLKELALKCLIKSDFNPSEEEKDKLHQQITETIGIMTWNLSARKSVERNNDLFLKEVLDKEIVRWRSYLFDLLSITYDRISVVKIKENLESETVESVNYALEMIDIVIDETIKQKLIMLVDVVPDEEKLKNLYQFYPVEIPEYNKLVEDIINRDYNLVSIWTKACVLKGITEVESETLTESIVALFFSPEEILQEEAVRIISSSGKELYRSISHRVPGSSKIRLDRIANGEVPKEEFIFERTRFLSNCFPSVPEEELLTIATQLKFWQDFNALYSQISDNSLIWPITSNRKSDRVHIHYDGKLSEAEVNTGISGMVSYYTLSMAAAETFGYQFPESSFEIYDYINTNEV
jgi:ATP:ADP antiporter, AAA family